MRPMLATPGPIPHGQDWTYEVKWDGMRILAAISGGVARLTSRNGGNKTAAFPELAGLGGLGGDVLLDGEVVALDDAGVPDFERLTDRMGVTSRATAAALANRIPVTYVIFDLLALDGVSLVDRPYRQRRELLASLSMPEGPWVVPETFADPDALLAATQRQGLEGVVAKRWSSAYQPGVRSPDWVKHSHRSSTDAVVVGWRGTRGQIASLALAQPRPGGGFDYRGTAGSGLSAAKGRVLLQQLEALPAGSPAAVAGLEPQEADRLKAFRWVQPAATVEIRHLGLTRGGRFRQPVVERVRPDLPARANQPDPPTAGRAVRVAVAGRTLRISHLDKVLYPATGTTKAQVIEYYTVVAPHLLGSAADRPITRRRWPDGVAQQSFFEKNLPAWAPEWIRRVEIPTSDGSTTFPVLGRDDLAGLVWLAAHAALELHTPQWRVDDAGAMLAPDRLVIDLDPGAPADLADCARVAVLVRDALAAHGFTATAVLSGSKGLHLYAHLAGGPRLPAHPDSDAVTGFVHTLADDLASQNPDDVVAVMAKSRRSGRVFLDWSQNRAAKTTLAPWSLRGTAEPFAAVPVSWDEVESGELRQLQLAEAMSRVSGG